MMKALSPNQTGGRSKAAATIKSEQKTYRDYGLRDMKNYSAAWVAAMPSGMPKASSVEEAFERVSKTLLGDRDSRLINTPVGSVLIKENKLQHIVEKRSDARERHVSLIIPTITDPDEVWLTEYSYDFRRGFIKVFRGKKRHTHALVITKEDAAESLFWNFMPSRPSHLDKRRVGVLLYQRWR